MKIKIKVTRHDYKSVTRIRKMLRLNVPTFARFLGVQPRTVQAWELGVRYPSKMACRILDEIDREPIYWRRSFERCVQTTTLSPKIKSSL